MEDKNLTVYQKLTRMFGMGAQTPEKSEGQQQPTQTYNLDRGELLRTQSREEFEKKKLELQQNKYLQDRWVKIDNELYNQSLYYEPNRQSSYFDFEGMEYTPEIAAALDILSEEATTPSEKGNILTIYSESNRIKTILTNLFENVLDVNTNLQMWTRNLCKYGDNFVYLKIEPERGIIGCNQMPNIEIERHEGNLFKNSQSTDSQGNLKPKEVKFIWKTKSEMEFQAWEMAHFRLLGDDRKLPYGTSMLEKARRIWKQLLLAEDAMLIYRTSRAPERRVFKVFVGNMDDKDVEAYVQKVANKFKRDIVVDSKNGNVDTRYNQMAVDQDYFIPVRDPAAPNPIETLPGASNLGEIADIEYIQKKLLAAIRIPKAFLGFEEVVGDGKQLSMLDVRFARTINKVQKAVVAELNKIAVIHLYMLGLEDELDNFTLGLTNPSTQADLLKIEQWKEKILFYKDAVIGQDQEGIAPVSHTWAKKNILGMSDDEIKLDLQQQRLERAIAEELKNTKTIITSTGLFTNIDKIYGDPNAAAKAPAAEGDDTGGGGGSMGGGGGMSSLPSGGDDFETADMGAGEEPVGTDTGAPADTTGGAAPPAGDMGTPPPAGDTAPPAEEEPAPTLNEQKKGLGKMMSLFNEKHGFILDLEKGRKSLNVINESIDKLLEE